MVSCCCKQMCCGLQTQVVVDKDYGQPLEIEADHIYLPDEGDAVYDDEVAGLVASLYEGFNSTVFAYGEGALSQLLD